MCLLSVWMKNRISFLEKPGNHYRCVLEITERLAGTGYRDIARELEEKEIASPYAYLTGKGFVCYKINVRLQWTAQIVSKILKNPVYAGIMENHKTETVLLATKATRVIPKEERIYVEQVIIQVSMYQHK